MKLHKVSSRVYANWDDETGGNVGIIELSDRAIAVDAQYPGSARKFRAAIPKVTKKPLSHLLLTHIHSDHVFDNMVFKDLEIVSHRRLWEKMKTSLKNDWAPGNLEKMLETYRKDAPERWWLFEGLEIVVPTITFTEKWEIDGVEFINLGGHSDCSSVVYVPDDKTLFAGDLLFVGRFPWAEDPTANPDKWIEAFKAILKRDIETIVSGHGRARYPGSLDSPLGWALLTRHLIDVDSDDPEVLVLFHGLGGDHLAFAGAVLVANEPQPPEPLSLVLDDDGLAIGDNAGEPPAVITRGLALDDLALVYLEADPGVRMDALDLLAVLEAVEVDPVLDVAKVHRHDVRGAIDHSPQPSHLCLS